MAEDWELDRVLTFFLETGFLCVALAVLELTLYTRLAWNSEIRPPLPPSAGIKGVRHDTQIVPSFFYVCVFYFEPRAPCLG